MKELTFEELKQLQMDILDDVAKFCEENDILYFLSAGTLIGAIRHNGYIPWDDDIDIMMPRPDYERFVSSFNGYKPHLSMLAPELDWNYFAPYANVWDNRTTLIEGANSHNGYDIGVKIDVFPLDGIPESSEEYNKRRNAILKLNKALHAKRVYLKKIKKPKLFLGIIFRRIQYAFYSYSEIQKEIATLATLTPYSEAKYVYMLIMDCFKEYRVSKEAFSYGVKHVFEDRCYLIPNGYNEYLVEHYGDYMKFPPKEQQVAHHNFKAFWK